MIAAVILAGAGGGYSAARVVTTVRDGREIERRDIVATVVFGTLMVTSALLLWLVDGR